MVYNFNSGPSILPQPVLEKASQAILDFNGSGLSLLEIGHRTPLFGEVLDRATAAVRQLMSLTDEYAVLFLHGGATTQFMQVPMNLLDENGLGLYGVNGVWGEKAYKEGGLFGPVQVVSDGRPLHHEAIPKMANLPPATYLHLTSNNTVEGTQIHQLPFTQTPLVLDMSSDIFSRPFAYTDCDLIYAGAQKNMGAAGVNLVVVKKSLLGKINRKVPTILDYQQHIAAGSLM
ncbi:MAG: 3-phosphoserine/phosphohydroxythreonine transaminase, partial [Sphingobacteriia bacterium]